MSSQMDTQDSNKSPDFSEARKNLAYLRTHVLNGQHENQVCEGEEADLHKHMLDCKKNPGHSSFIPYKKFEINDLSEEYRDVDLFEFVKVVADLTVRIKVKKVSKERQEFWPDTNMPYPFYDKKGTEFLRTGSGQVNEVIQFTDGVGRDRHGKDIIREYKKCMCRPCRNSDSPKNVWWEVVVRTATHVVYDDIECADTSCRLFYDEEKSELFTLEDLILLEVNIEQDWCLISYMSCGSMAYRERLLSLVVQRVDLWKKVCNKFQNSKNYFTFIVSHPHGYAKQVSFGVYLDNYKVGKFDDKLDLMMLTYNTPTCPGSSGAPVRCVGLGVGHVHNGSLPSNGLNYSGVSLVFPDGSPYVKF
ncbi:uncharacterized protein LOC106053064 [Biomphalaria glabrata]|uniref:Uncharacterized protein LOC106053064 n=1 Tax=Biomphalaria glabrata TaxID=6526 RepID=A0A9W3BE60_BIOGL|nr:uncharacterized protein LOC106053064 [Biomphalaria glabrata]